MISTVHADAERTRQLPEHLRNRKPTHLMSWLEGAYIHCRNGSQDWCEGYLHPAVAYIRALEDEVIELREQMNS